MKSLHVALAVALGLAALTGPAAASEAIAKKARCVACHAVDQKRVGPAFKDVAAKYKGQPDALAQLSEKVRAGGMGVWGQVPMPAHAPERLSDADLKAVVEWVLQMGATPLAAN
jgi:cytochrome c